MNSIKHFSFLLFSFPFFSFFSPFIFFCFCFCSLLFFPFFLFSLSQTLGQLYLRTTHHVFWPPTPFHDEPFCHPRSIVVPERQRTFVRGHGAPKTLRDFRSRVLSRSSGLAHRGVCTDPFLTENLFCPKKILLECPCTLVYYNFRVFCCCR